MERHYTDGTEPTILPHLKRPYVPMGCDQQGRMPDRIEAPEPAESCTDVGFVDEMPEQDIVKVVFQDLLISLAVVAAFASIVLWVLG